MRGTLKRRARNKRWFPHGAIAVAVCAISRRLRVGARGTEPSGGAWRAALSVKPPSSFAAGHGARRWRHCGLQAPHRGVRKALEGATIERARGRRRTRESRYPVAPSSAARRQAVAHFVRRPRNCPPTHEPPMLEGGLCMPARAGGTLKRGGGAGRVFLPGAIAVAVCAISRRLRVGAPGAEPSGGCLACGDVVEPPSSFVGAHGARRERDRGLEAPHRGVRKALEGATIERAPGRRRTRDSRYPVAPSSEPRGGAKRCFPHGAIVLPV
jgi:hypothetical protein